MRSRHVGPSLEERLALASDDSSHAEALATRGSCRRMPTERTGTVGQHLARRGGREITIRIGERDGIIDQKQPSRFATICAHFFEGTEALNALPRTIEIKRRACSSFLPCPFCRPPGPGWGEHRLRA